MVEKKSIREAVLELLQERGTPARMTEVFREVTLTDLLTVAAGRLGRNPATVRQQAKTLSMESLVKALAKRQSEVA